jgi:carbon storage regulator
MLVLSRQRDETIMIGDDVEITVVDIRGDKVRLGINAPRHIQVHRKEVYEAIKRENQQAANLTPTDVAPAIEGGGTNVHEAKEIPDQHRSSNTRRSQG